MLLKSEIPWHIVAIVFIAFASWVWNKIQEVAAERKRRRFQQVKRSYEQQERQQNQQRPKAAASPPATPPPAQAKSPLQQMLDAMTGNVEEIRRQQELAEAQRRSQQQQQQSPPRPQASAPAPAPIRKTTENPPPLPGRTPQKSTAVSENPQRPLRAPVTTKPDRSLSRRKKRQSGVRSLLRGKDSLRHALIASEILQKPKGLENERG